MSVTRRAAAVLALILAVAVVLSAVGAVAGCRKAPASRPTDAGATAGGNEAPASLYARMKVALYRGNAPEELVDVGEVVAGQEVKVVSVEGAWTQVEADAASGWLPNWYLTATQDDLLDEIEPYSMFTKDLADLCLTPETPGQPLLQLGPGRVVEVKTVWEDWAYVAIRVYSIPDISRGWVRASALGTRSEVTPVEADLLAGTRVYFNDFSAPPDAAAASELTTYDMWVTIDSVAGPWTMVSAAGGWVAWVKTADLHYPDTGPGQ